MDVPQIITEIVKRNGFDYAKYLGEYKGEQVFQPCFDSDEAYFGRPRYLYVKGEKYVGVRVMMKQVRQCTSFMINYFEDYANRIC